jgi:NarL family two-component system response regulator LiaR
MAPNFFIRHKQTILYGISLAILLFLLKWLELKFLILSHSMEVFIGAIAIIFTSLGIWLAIKLTKPKVVMVEKEVVIEKEIFIREEQAFVQDEKQLQEIGLSKREMEVLLLMAEGLSNNEIAERIFVSLSTVKTHTNRIFEKMDVQRRTQAIEKAKRLKIIA